MPESSASRSEAGTSRRFLTFGAGGRAYALPAEIVGEVIDMPAVSRIPQAPPCLLGIANLRGLILPVVALSKLLDTGKRTDHSTARAIVISADAPLALAVSFVDGLVSIEPDRVETREAELGAEDGERLTGAFELPAAGGIVKVLDIDTLLAAAFVRRQPARTQAPARSAGRLRTYESSGEEHDASLLVVFEVAGQEFALDIETVQEILPAPSTLTGVPRSESLVLGVTSLRDRLLPLLSLRSLLGFSTDSESDGREAVIVARVGGTRVGLVADRARAILSAPASSIDPVPAVLAARVGGESRIKAICRADQGRRLVSLLAPEQLFREDVMRRIEQDLSQAAPHEREDNLTPQNLLSFLVFRLGDDEYALPIDAVDEVGEVPSRVTRLPKTPKFLEGVVNLRGELLPVIDQCRRFDIPVSDHAERRRLLVVHSAGQRAGLIVDGVSDVLHVPSDALEPPPELTEHVGQLVQGVINLASQQRLVLVLDPAGLLTSKERDVLDRFNPASSQANA